MDIPRAGHLSDVQGGGNRQRRTEKKTGGDGQEDQSGPDSHQNVTDRQTQEKTNRPNVKQNRRPPKGKDREKRKEGKRKE